MLKVKYGMWFSTDLYAYCVKLWFVWGENECLKFTEQLLLDKI